MRSKQGLALRCVAGLLAAALSCAVLADTTAVSTEKRCSQDWIDSHLRMNQLQLIGTHNSYKLALPDDELAAHRAVDAAGADSIDYAHRPLAEQLDRGLRSLELDVYPDPQGGRYLQPPGAHRRGYAQSPWILAERQKMQRPGFKVMHLADIDFRSSCLTLQDCLTIVREWSQAHPRHLPILITLNAKDGRGGAGAMQPLPFDAAAFDALDAEIRAALPDDLLLTPDQVQGAHPTLRDAVRTDGWPLLAQARGKVFLALDEDARKVALYRGARRSLEGRAMFVNSDEASPAAAYLTLNDPLGDQARITRAVAAGYLVRTRADADTREARSSDTRRREAAFRSGAQYVSTDYPWPDQRWGDYRVTFPSDAPYARLNPADGNPKCPSLILE
jgi:hypothetical protein